MKVFLFLLTSLVAPTAFLFAQAILVPTQGQNIEAARRALEVGTDQEKTHAGNYLTTAYLRGDQTTKKTVASIIVSILSAPMKAGELWNDDSTPRAKACIIAGHAEIESTIPALIALLKPLPGQSKAHYYEGLPIENEDGQELGFAARALVDIGKPAILALNAEQQQTGDPVVRSIIKSVLSDIEFEEPYKEQKRRMYR